MKKIFNFSKWQGYGSTSQRSRNRMVDELVQKDIKNHHVLDVMRYTPRHCFVDSALAHQAYSQASLPIVGGQTISQPFIVAYMTEYLLDHALQTESVLEIGTGCGYQSVVLSQCFEQVYSIERIEVLFNFAMQNFQLFGIENINAVHADGYAGWQENMQFDAMIFTASTKEVPNVLLQQMKVGGVLIAPLESIEGSQYLVGIHRDEDGFRKKVLKPVHFVKMLHGLKIT